MRQAIEEARLAHLLLDGAHLLLVD